MAEYELEIHYFISYSHSDIDIAMRIKKEMERCRFEIWMDDDRIIAGLEWEDAIRNSIRRSIAVLYLVSPTSRTSDYVAQELELAKIYRRKIIPLWIRGDTAWANVVTFGFFRTQYIDLRGELYEAGIERLTQTLKNLPNFEASFMNYFTEDDDSRLREARGTIKLPPTYEGPEQEGEMPEDTDEIRNPYKGLHAFEYKDAWSFFGRDNLIHEMVQQVKIILSEERTDSQVPRCMMVVGASGSGKSSVVMAGLLPALEDKKNIPEVKCWFFLEPVRPGEDPMNALAQALRLPFLNAGRVGVSPLKRWSRADLRDTLDGPDSRGLNALLRKIARNSDDRIVLIIDQFEEIFAPTIHSDQQRQRERFINLLMAAATEPGTPLLLLFTLRADFYDSILDNETLSKKVKRHRIDIPLMTREELRSVIEKPVQHPDVNVTFDPYLAEDLLYEVRKHPESLPLLQFTLEQLFEHREGRRLTRQSYDQMGELQGAINKHAEDIYKYQLRTDQHRAEAKKLFTEYFVYIPESHDEPSHLESGEGVTRRRVTQAELKLNDPRSSIRRETIDAFVNARLLTTTSTASQTTDLAKENIPNSTYEISHEALINAWERFRQWIKEDRKDLYLLQSLRQRMKQWDEEKNLQRKNDLLVEKLDLQQLQDCGRRRTLKPLEDKFLQASLAQRRHQKIRGYLLFVGVTALVILSLVLGLFIHNLLFPDPTIVTSSADSGPGTLPYVLQKAGDGATITFDARLRGQTISLAHGSLDINKSLTIRGPSGGISISSGTTGNYVAIEAGSNVTLDNMTFTSSYPLKHSIIENAGNLTINQSSLTDNKSYNRAGAIYNTGSLILSNDIIEGNKVTTDGGAIHNLYGSVSINNSTIRDNEAYGNGGGVYSQGGVVTISGSRVVNNRADSNAGGGIEMVNGSLSMSGTQIASNHSDYTRGSVSGGIGGGIAIVGSVAFITTSVITNNTASMRGGGIAVTKNTGNSFTSLVKLKDIIPTENPSAIYYIRENGGGDIAGAVTTTGTTLQILDDPDIDTLGNPPDTHPIEKSPNYLGVADLNGFCLNHGGSYGQISKDADPKDILFICLNQSNQDVGTNFAGQTICQAQYAANPGVDTVIDRMAYYYDPSSLQCYKNLKRLGSIRQEGFAKYCASQPQYTGLFDNSKYRDTAYDWLCQPKDASKLPRGLTVADACNLQYNVKDAIDRLANYNSVDGWECWEPA